MQLDVQVNDLRALEKQDHKVEKLGLDIRCFDTCLDLVLCPNFFKHKAPNMLTKIAEFYFKQLLRKIKRSCER